MLKRFSIAWMLAMALAIFAFPVLAAQGGVGGVHFGAYELAEGDSVTGDLVVFGPVTLGADSELDGDLAAFGGVVLKEDAIVTGDLVVFGEADVAGIVEGNLFSAGEARIRETAVVNGNVAVSGTINQEEGATIDGDIEAVEDWRGFHWDVPFGTPGGPVDFDVPPARPAWAEALWTLVRGTLTVLVLAIFALLIASIWPTEMERVGAVLVESPIPSFGIGLLALFISGVVVAILVITICLSPFGLIGAVIAGLGVAMGWVALGAVLGDRILRGLFKSTTVTPVGSAILGTLVITLLAVLVNMVSECLYTILILPLFALAAGAVTLTRFGTMPYASQGVSSRPVSPPPARPSQPPVVPEPPVEEVQLSEPEVLDSEEIPSPYGEAPDSEDV